jgi:lysophospholipase L1-like esterase
VDSRQERQEDAEEYMGLGYKSFVILFLFCVTANSSSSCFLPSNTPMNLTKDMGYVNFIKMDSDNIYLNKSDVVKFDFNHLYKISVNGKFWMFRGNYYVYENKMDGISGITWAENAVPVSSGVYKVEEYESPRPEVYGKTMVTIGDSITWSQYGRYLRCLLIDNDIGYDFIGTKTDTFGFKHEGAGGNNSQDVLNRIEKIPTSDSYFILLGTNDINFTPEQTVSNLAEIVKKLKIKNNNSVIYISTLLPRKGKPNDRNLMVNDLLKQKKLPNNVFVLDTAESFYKKGNWEAYFLKDALHPNYAGYELLTSVIIDKLKSKGETNVNNSN